MALPLKSEPPPVLQYLSWVAHIIMLVCSALRTYTFPVGDVLCWKCPDPHDMDPPHVLVVICLRLLFSRYAVPAAFSTPLCWLLWPVDGGVTVFDTF